jgi:pseudaminic acid biosynthesis-associated methylase
MSKNDTPTTMKQQKLWQGEFGDAYTERNAASPEQLRARVALWARMLAPLAGDPPRSILEVGANLGINLRALRALTGARFYAVEPNDKARSILVQDGLVATADLRGGTAAAIDFPADVADLAFTSGVLIHIHPDQLLASCREIHRCARRYVACAEYFSQKPESIPYRGQTDVLFKRDFGAFWMDNFPDLRFLECGFAWKPVTGLDDLTWWLFQKRS